MPNRSTADYLRRDASHHRIKCVNRSSIGFSSNVKKIYWDSALAHRTNEYRRNDRFSRVFQLFKRVFCGNHDLADAACCRAIASNIYRLPGAEIIYTISSSTSEPAILPKKTSTSSGTSLREILKSASSVGNGAIIES